MIRLIFKRSRPTSRVEALPFLKGCLGSVTSSPLSDAQIVPRDLLRMKASLQLLPPHPLHGRVNNINCQFPGPDRRGSICQVEYCWMDEE